MRAAVEATPVLDAGDVGVVLDLEAVGPQVRASALATVAEAERVIARTRLLDAAHARAQQVGRGKRTRPMSIA